MGKQYDDSRYGIEKILTLPIVTLTSTDTIYATLTLTEDITLVSFGLIITTAVTAAGTLATVTIIKSAAANTTLGTLTVASGTALGASTSTTTLTTTSLSSGDTFIVKAAASAVAGAGQAFVKYRERFITG